MGRGDEALLEAVKTQDYSAVHKLLQKGKAKLLSSSKKVNVNFQVCVYHEKFNHYSLLKFLIHVA